MKITEKVRIFIGANRFLPLDKVASQLNESNNAKICKRTFSRQIKKLSIKSFKADEKTFL